MTTPLTITSLNQGKIYKDWTLETVDDAKPAKWAFLLAWLKPTKLIVAIHEFASHRHFGSKFIHH